MPINFYKMHGSMNWAVHENCKYNENNNQVQLLPINAMRKYRKEVGGKCYVHSQAYLRDAKCLNTGCANAGSLIPLVVPPVWNKTSLLKYEALIKIWNSAIREIESAEQIVFVGYSFPKSDSYFRFLLANGLIKNSNLRRVFFVDPNVDYYFEEVQKRFQRGIELVKVKSEFRVFCHTQLREDVYEK